MVFVLLVRPIVRLVKNIYFPQPKQKYTTSRILFNQFDVLPNTTF